MFYCCHFGMNRNIYNEKCFHYKAFLSDNNKCIGYLFIVIIILLLRFLIRFISKLLHSLDFILFHLLSITYTIIVYFHLYT